MKIQHLIESGLTADEKLAMAMASVNKRRPESTVRPYTLHEEREFNCGSCVVWLGGGTCGHWVLDRPLAAMTVDEIADVTIRRVDQVQLERQGAWRRMARHHAGWAK